MTIRVGDIVSRPYGSLSTRADVEYTVVEANKKQIKITTDVGNLQWFGINDWRVIRTEWKEITYWGVIYKAAQNSIPVMNCSPTESLANSFISTLNEIGYILIAKKKLTIPYKDPQPNEA